MTVPPDILEAYGFSDQAITPLSGGLINDTFLVGPSGHPVAVLQKLHPIFEMEVNLDIAAITARLAQRGMETPRLIETRSGDGWIDRWRALTFVPGKSLDALESPSQAETAAALVGRFHSALSDWNYQFKFVREGVHDTSAHLNNLRLRVDQANQIGSSEPVPGTFRLAKSIISRGVSLPTWSPRPRRICHGDLKISNVRFGADDSARCLLDLDTLAHQTLAYEMGDALRSWCNRAREDAAPVFDEDIFEAALRGYRRGMPESVGEDELADVVPGTIAVCVELAARFCADIFDDSYFGWDATRFASRVEHNHARATAMLALADLVNRRTEVLNGLVLQPR